MPAFEFSYPQAMNYTELRDASGHLVGLAEPGDRRIFDEAPDHMWTPAESGLSDAVIAAHDGPMTAVEHPADGTWSPSAGDEPRDEAPAVPPAVIPQ